MQQNSMMELKDTARNSFKKCVERYRQHCFSARVVEPWSELNEKIVMATSVDDFKINLSTI